MNDEQTERCANRLLDLENQLRLIDVEYRQTTHQRKFQLSKERMLAFRYHLKYKELCSVRTRLGWPEPRKEPAWVRKYTEDSIVQYIAYGE